MASHTTCSTTLYGPHSGRAICVCRSLRIPVLYVPNNVVLQEFARTCQLLPKTPSLLSAWARHNAAYARLYAGHSLRIASSSLSPSTSPSCQTSLFGLSYAMPVLRHAPPLPPFRGESVPAVAVSKFSTRPRGGRRHVICVVASRSAVVGDVLPLRESESPFSGRFNPCSGSQSFHLPGRPPVGGLWLLPGALV